MSALRTAAIAALAAVALDGALLAQEAKLDSPDGKRTEVRREVRVRIGGSYLGVGIDDMDAEAKGAKVVSVSENSPAASIGLQDGDVITSFNGQTVEGAMQLRRLIVETPAGRTVTVGYTRNGAPQTATVKLAERPMVNFDRTFTFPAVPNLPTMPEMPNLRSFSFKCDTNFVMLSGDSGMAAVWSTCMPMRPRLGVNTADIAPATGTTDGRVMVTGVIEKSAAAEAGLQPGDVLLDVAGTPIHNTGDLQRALKAREEGPVSIRIKRDCEERTVSATLSKLEKVEQREFHLNRNGKEIHIFGNGNNLRLAMPEQIEIEVNGMEDALQEGGQGLQQKMEELRRNLQDNSANPEFSLQSLPALPPTTAVAASNGLLEL